MKETINQDLELILKRHNIVLEKEKLENLLINLVDYIEDCEIDAYDAGYIDGELKEY